jgi:iron complex outermembrane recepter protein
MMKKLLSESSWALASLLVLSPFTFAYAQQEALSDVDPLLEMSLEQLMNVEVTSVMKTATRLSDTPAAIYVLTSEDIHRSGVTTIPEALRFVPGMHVARIDANKWAITARGFNSQFANKLLVLVDGRSVYTPLYAGVWWDQQDVIMEDIERIEVIRGPGASLWGANAVNGVINIITKSAKNTQGGLLSAHAGDERQGAGLRYGAKVGDDAYLKVYGRSTRVEDTNSPDPNPIVDSGDAGKLGKAGFRFEKDLNNQHRITLQGDVLDGDSNGNSIEFPRVTGPFTPVTSPPYSEFANTSQDHQAFNLLGRWDNQYADAASTMLQVYWNNEVREIDHIGIRLQADTLDIEFQHNFKFNSYNNIVWGLGYRRNMADFSDTNLLVSSNPDHTDNIFSIFLQDNIALLPEKLQLTLGARLEKNPYNDLVTQPNARLLWTPNANHSIWTSISRAVRTPFMSATDANFAIQTIPPVGGGAASPFNPAVLVNIAGNPDVDNEEMTAYEIGWRGTIHSNLQADATFFYYDYNRLDTLSPLSLDTSTILSSFVTQGMQFSNYGYGESYGGEFSLDWQILDSWRMRASYSYFENELNLKASAPANTENFFGGKYPQDQLKIWSQHQITPTVTADVNLRYVSSLDNASDSHLASYGAMDAHIAWKATKNLELGLVGLNILGSERQEFFGEFLSSATEAPKEFYFTGIYKF